MQDTFTVTSRLVVTVLWTVVALLLLAAWVVWIEGGTLGAVLVGLTACVVSAAAATAHVRSYASRICDLISATRPRDSERPHVLRD